MAATYRRTAWRRGINAVVRAMLKLGLGPPRTYLLTVHGRKSGRPYSTPVTLGEDVGQRWLVAPYGEVAWVRNARAASRVTLTRGRVSSTVALTELKPEESAPILKRYVTEVPITRPFFDARPDSPPDAFVAEAHRHPVFRISTPQIVNLAADLDEFLALHHLHGGFTPTVGELTPNGYRLEVACPCGVTFERWVTPLDAAEDLLREHLKAERN